MVVGRSHQIKLFREHLMLLRHVIADDKRDSSHCCFVLAILLEFSVFVLLYCNKAYKFLRNEMFVGSHACRGVINSITSIHILHIPSL